MLTDARTMSWVRTVTEHLEPQRVYWYGDPLLYHIVDTGEPLGTVKSTIDR
jgi:hypothetical protein